MIASGFLVPALGIVFGAILGSFIATMLLRWPQGRSVIAGRSRCDQCEAKLGARDLVPVLSYAALFGRCRRCGAAIDRAHLAIELTAAFLGITALVAHPLPLAVVTAGLGLWLLLLALLDLRHQWLPDRLTLPLIPLGLVSAWAGLGPPLNDRLMGAAAGWAGLVVVGFVYRRIRGREGLGGGDAKLLGAIGAWVGLFNLPFILLGAGLIGLAAVGLMLLRGAHVDAATRLPLGTLMAIVAWPIWLIVAPPQGFAFP